jgi:hypothetical protein
LQGQVHRLGKFQRGGKSSLTLNLLKQEKNYILGGIKMLEKLLGKARAAIIEEMNRVGYIDDSDLTDRFLDNLAYELTVDNEGIDQDELLEAIKDEIMIEYNKIGFVNDAADYTGCYYKDTKDAIRWAKKMEGNDEDVQEVLKELNIILDD